MAGVFTQLRAGRYRGAERLFVLARSIVSASDDSADPVFVTQKEIGERKRFVVDAVAQGHVPRRDPVAHPLKRPLQKMAYRLTPVDIILCVIFDTAHDLHGRIAAVFFVLGYKNDHRQSKLAARGGHRMTKARSAGRPQNTSITILASGMHYYERVFTRLRHVFTRNRQTGPICYNARKSRWLKDINWESAVDHCWCQLAALFRF